MVSAGAFRNRRLPGASSWGGWKGLLTLQIAVTLHLICIRLGVGGGCSFFWHFRVKMLLLLQADQILIFFFSHFSNHSEGPGSFTQGMGNERVGEAEDGGKGGAKVWAFELLPSWGRRRSCQQEDGDSREGIFSLGSVPVHSRPASLL